MRSLYHRHYEINQVGRDYVMGDLHGGYDEMFEFLEDLGFHFENDRLFSLGDIVDRGPKSLECLKLIREPWFYAVQGNHEDMMLNSILDGLDAEMWLANGGMWALDVVPDELWELCNEVRKLPYAMTVETPEGKFGMCHAEPPTRRWSDVEHPTIYDVNVMLWARKLAKMAKSTGQSRHNIQIDGVVKVYCGHSVFKEVTHLGNITFIDTGCGFDFGRLSIMEISAGE